MLFLFLKKHSSELGVFLEIKKARNLGFVLFKIAAENEGFEPPEVLPSIVFKTTAIDHSANSPSAKVNLFPFHASLFYSFLKIIINF